MKFYFIFGRLLKAKCFEDKGLILQNEAVISGPSIMRVQGGPRLVWCSELKSLFQNSYKDTTGTRVTSG